MTREEALFLLSDLCARVVLVDKNGQNVGMTAQEHNRAQAAVVALKSKPPKKKRGKK